MNTSIEKNVKTTFPTKLSRPLDSYRTFSTNRKILTNIWTGINFRQAVYLWLIYTLITRFSTAIILRIDHGHDIISDDDPYLKIMSDITYTITHCATPMSNIVDLLPISCVILHSHFGYPNQTKPNLIVKYLPSWFPGTYAATQARSFRPFVDLMHDYPFEDVKKQLVRSPQALSSIITLHWHTWQ